ncbi:hypothetical protein KDJ21_004340 [Metabacillus litoralis]|uniref:hypothetical protein n=1 Tax=Metabacillus litoralis TaxID=152268 RepID=UPI001E2F249A|nr:hypothetical protein [Metabacillus litoralis]UHA60929.1 hypothetical protein KDJ21_004340 [Metabacillus litoralis]
MIYYLFHEKERKEIEQMLIRELSELDDLIYIRESLGEGNSVRERALKEKEIY